MWVFVVLIAAGLDILFTPLASGMYRKKAVVLLLCTVSNGDASTMFNKT